MYVFAALCKGAYRRHLQIWKGGLLVAATSISDDCGQKLAKVTLEIHHQHEALRRLQWLQNSLADHKRELLQCLLLCNEVVEKHLREPLAALHCPPPLLLLPRGQGAPTETAHQPTCSKEHLCLHGVLVGCAST